MSNIVDEIKKLFVADTKFTFLIVSKNKSLVESICGIIMPIENCVEIVLSSLFTKEHKESDNVAFYESISSKFNKNKKAKDIDSTCIIFTDFNGTRKIVGDIDYFDQIDRYPKFRRLCRNVIMYNYIGEPVTNGFWKCDKSFDVSNIRSYILKLSDWGSLCQSIPEVVDFSSDTDLTDIFSNTRVSTLWLNNLVTILRHILMGIVGREDYVTKMLDDENRGSWIRMFIHETFNCVYNYELIEFLGDSIAGAKFDIYMVSKYGRLTKAEASEFHNQYMSKHHQSYIAEDMKLPQLLLYDRSMIKMCDKFKTDLFESFVGTLYQTAQTISVNLAEIVTLNYITMIGEQFPFEKKMIFGFDSHRVVQIGDSFKLGSNIFAPGVYEENKGSKNAKTTLYFKRDTPGLNDKIQELKNEGHDISSILDVTYKYSPHEISSIEDAKTEYYKKLANILDKANVDIRLIERQGDSFIKILSTINNVLYTKLVERLRIEFPDRDPLEMIKRIQFKSHKDLHYVSMYIHTFEALEGSKLLTSLSKYENNSQLVGDEYRDNFTEEVRIVNCANVHLPEEKGYINEETNELKPMYLACYRCVEKYVTV